MKTFKTQKQLESKELVFEPGNATRYHLVLTQVENEYFIMTDMNDRKVIFINKNSTPESLAYHIQYTGGYSKGDAEPMAEYILKALKEIAFITYRMVDHLGGIEFKTAWFENTDYEWNRNFEVIGEDGHTVIDQGTIW